jgi:MFS family permease
VSLLAAIYPAVWGLAQFGTGALSDHLGRKWLVTAGMLVQASGIFLIMLMHGFWPWAGGAALLGSGRPSWPPGRQSRTATART